MSKACKWCESTQHSSFYCYKKPRKPLKVANPKPLKRTPIKQNGKHAALWITARKDWFTVNPQDLYTCHYCYKQMPRNMTTLDHLESRSRRPDLRYELSNLVPCCWTCNTTKGPQSHDQFCTKCVLNK